jgi:alkylation response protein AidB-like acyl-CoA dehydrogenase
VTGTKLWTSQAQHADYIIALVRTDDQARPKHAGLTQVIVDMRAKGVLVSPIEDMTGARDINEVVLDDVFVPDDFVLGVPGSGWRLVTGELAYERSGPERFMSTFTLLEAMRDGLNDRADGEATASLGRMITHFIALRRMSNAVAGMLEKGMTPDVEAAMVKGLGAGFENAVIDTARQAIDAPPVPGSDDGYRRILAEAMLASPSFTLRGGTREILRTIVAKQLTRP